MSDLVPGIYKHFKGGMYHVYGVANNTETNELVVVYSAQYGPRFGKLATRPLPMFIEHVEKPEFNYRGPRFTLVEERDFLSEKTVRYLPGIAQDTESNEKTFVFVHRDGRTFRERILANRSFVLETSVLCECAECSCES